MNNLNYLFSANNKNLNQEELAKRNDNHNKVFAFSHSNEELLFPTKYENFNYKYLLNLK
jgi:hypothetical protein